MKDYLTPRGRINRGRYLAATIIMSFVGWVGGELIEYTDSIPLLIISLAAGLFIFSSPL